MSILPTSLDKQVDKHDTPKNDKYFGGGHVEAPLDGVYILDDMSFFNYYPSIMYTHNSWFDLAQANTSHLTQLFDSARPVSPTFFPTVAHLDEQAPLPHIEPVD